MAAQGESVAVDLQYKSLVVRVFIVLRSQGAKMCKQLLTCYIEQTSDHAFDFIAKMTRANVKRKLHRKSILVAHKNVNMFVKVAL